jgi:hypothetical protein
MSAYIVTEGGAAIVQCRALQRPHADGVRAHRAWLCRHPSPFHSWKVDLCAGRAGRSAAVRSDVGNNSMASGTGVERSAAGGYGWSGCSRCSSVARSSRPRVAMTSLVPECAGDSAAAVGCLSRHRPWHATGLRGLLRPRRPGAGSLSLPAPGGRRVGVLSRLSVRAFEGSSGRRLQSDGALIGRGPSRRPRVGGPCAA